jgi:hypothetical protein
MTTDIDLNVFIPHRRWEEVSRALIPLGIDPAPPPPDNEGRLELIWDTAGIDVFFSQDALHDEMRSATRKVPFAESAIPIVAPEHLAVRKAICDRPKDWLDIEQILVATSPLDLPEIEAWLEAMVGESDQRLARLREIAERLSLS